tara:strand:+ start:3031 stop:3600 length:570 start_codon:yes stop_codon:yes gene_type:complete
MFYLLDRANNKTGKLFPSQQRLADDANISVVSAKRGVKKLIELGYLVRNTKGYPGRANDYSIQYVSVQSSTSISSVDNKYQLSQEQVSAQIPQLTNNQLNELTNELTVEEENKVVDINDMIKNLAKQKSMAYREVVDNNRGYKKNMDMKYRKLMSKKLSNDRYGQWEQLLSNDETRENAIDFAKSMCHG